MGVGVIEMAYWPVFWLDLGWLGVSLLLVAVAPRRLRRMVLLAAVYFTLELFFHGEAERGAAIVWGML